MARCPGQTQADQGARIAAARFVAGGRCDPRLEKFTEAAYRPESHRPEFLIKWHFQPAAGAIVVEPALGDYYAEHGLKTESLGAQLDFVGTVLLWLSPFVLDWKDPAIGVELNHITLARDSQNFTGDPESPGDSNARTGLVGAFVGNPVNFLAQCSKPILGPELLVVNEGALALAVQKMLEG
jgi:hypothetical protein